MKAMTVKLTDEEYKIIKKHLIDQDKKFQQYVLELIKKDLKLK